MTTQLQLDGLKTTELREICRKDAKLFSGHSNFTNKPALLRFMKERIGKTIEQQSSQPSEPTPTTAASTAQAAPAPGRKSKQVHTLQKLKALSREEIKEICVGNKKYKGYSYQQSKEALIEFILDRDNPDWQSQPEFQEPEKDELETPQPAICKSMVASAEEYLDDVAARAVYWPAQMGQTLNWECWQFAEAQGRDKYLSILHIPTRRHWVILWEWRSFEAACRELIRAISRVEGMPVPVDFIPSPGYLPAPPMPEEEPPDEDECLNCGGTGECPGLEQNCGCKSYDDCATLGLCVNCGDSGEGDQHPGSSPRREPVLVGV